MTSIAGPPARPRGQAYSLDELVSVAAEEFLRRGYDATSMEDLSRATGRAKSSIYHHVSGKEELLRLAVARALDSLFTVLDEAEAREGRSVDRLEEVLRASVRVLVAELGYVTLLLRVRGNTDTERWALSRRREFDRRVTAIVAQAVTEGDLRGDIEPALVTRLAFGTVNSLVDWLRPGGRHTAQVEEALVAVVLGGLRA